MSEKLRVEISGDEKDLQRAVKRAIKQIKDFERAAEKGIGNKLPNSTAKASKGMDGLKKSTANATPTLNEFSRVIQDAPFGIQGVANNITQLTSQFGYLQKATGSTGAALKAVLGSLAGPAGILLAVSTVTSLLVSFGDELFSTEKATKKADEALKDYVESLGKVDKARVTGAQSAQEEIVRLKQLRGVAEDTTQSNERRLKAVIALQDEFPSYFGNLSQEAILNGNLEGTYKSLTESILNRAKATAASETLVSNAKQEIVIAQQLAVVNDKIQKQQEALSNISAKGRTGDFKRSQINKVINDLLKERLKLQGQLQGLELSDIELSSLIGDVGGIDLSDIKLPDNYGLRVPVTGFNFEAAGLEGLSNPLADFATQLANTELAPIISEKQLRLQEALLRLNEGATQIINNTLANTFADIGRLIADSVQNGTNFLTGLGSTLLGALGGLLTQLGEMAIGVGVGLLAIEASLKSLGGVGAIAAGVALVALGSAFSGGAKKLSGSMGSGGSSSTGVSTGGNRTGGSFGGAVQGGTVRFEIEGTTLVGVLRRTLDRNRAIGNTFTI